MHDDDQHNSRETFNFNMANDDKGRRKWGGISQDTRSDCKSDRGRSIGVMRGAASNRAPPRAIYTPGSGPLKKSGRSSEEFVDERTKPISVQDRLKPQQFNSSVSAIPAQIEAGGIAERLNSARGNAPNCSGEGSENSSHQNHLDPRRRNKKPEQQLYVPKKVQEALAERDVANRSPVGRSGTPPVIQQQQQSRVGWDRDRDSVNRDWETQSNRSQRSDRNDRNYRNDRNDRNRNRAGRNNEGETRNNMTSNRGRPDDNGKRYSGNRRNRNPNENEEQREWRSKSPMSGRNDGIRRDYQREVRQGSEPLSVTPNNANEYNRTRDTRSVDPPGYAEKFPRKPPSGRHGGGKIPSKIDTLPPRFQRKFLAENGLDMPLGGGNNMFMKPSDDWDGSTVTFQGSSGYNNPSSMRNNYQPQSGWSNTIPARSRGRGRLRPEENEPPMGNFRPGTPDQYSAASSRSHTPSQEYMTRSYERRGSNSTMYTSMESLSRADNVPMAPTRLISPALPSHSNANRGCQPSSPADTQIRRTASPITTVTMSHHYNQQGERANNNTEEATSSSEKTKNERYSLNHIPTKFNEPYSSLPDMASIATLNWSEDVELDIANENEALQQENPSRSSSVMSSRDNGSISGRSGAPMGPPMGVGVGRNRGFKKKRRDQRRHSGAIEGDRSCSRDDGNRGKSRERMNNQQNRENDTLRVDPNNSNRRYEPGRRHRNGKMLRSRESSRERVDYRGVIRHVDDSRRNVEDSRRNVDENWRTGKRMSICDLEDGRGSSIPPNIHQSHSISGPSSNSDANVVIGRSISPVARGTNFQGPGVLVLPERNQISPRNLTNIGPRGLSQQQQHNPSIMQQRKTLFDPNNPGRPIIVRATGNRASLLPRDKDSQFSGGIPAAYNPHGVTTGPQRFAGYHGPSLEAGIAGIRPPAPYVAEQMQGNSRPPWYDPTSGILHEAKDPHLLLEVETVDRELQFWLLSSGGLIANWEKISSLRQSLKKTLQILLETDIKFCQAENVEQHFWKLLYYNMIEMLRKMMPKEASSETREACKQIMLKIIDEGTNYFENLLAVLENKYKFKLEVYLVSASPPNGLGLVGLALVGAQKIFLFLGDLARYKEQANETTNYGKSRQWYLKAQQINPKNGRPYNQLALLAHYARRKLDAVYYYMRSLMASNPFHSARESLIALFDENRKKYESTERKRKEEREWKERARMKEKEGANNAPGSLRRETWVHPGGKRVRRITSSTTANESKYVHSDSEELAQLTSVEVNKRFITSYLHVHGKLITKIGMETFQEAAIQMLREFRTLLQHSPLPIPETRLLQLLALNMFAIDTTQLKDSQMEQGYRSEVQERALVVSLQMFNLILERGVALLKCQFDDNQRHRLIVDEDMQVLLPAIKIWCDWMLCHSTVWNPPPSCTDYRVGPPGDSWSRLATMVNLLEMLEYSRQIVIQAKDVAGRQNDVDLIKLPEDTTLSGFTPLMSNPQDPCYADKSEDMEVAQMCLRIQKILFFGEVFLCGLETPVLKLQKSESGLNEYVSVVEASSPGSPSSPPEQSDSELLVESDLDDEDDDASNSGHLRSSGDSWPGSQNCNAAATTGEIRSLIERKGELEKRQRKQERHRQQVQALLKKSTVSVDIEVRPRLLVPDTNCFIDYLPQLQSIARVTSGTQPLYTLMIPLVVLNELEGLARGGDSRGCPPASRAALNPEHIARVGESAKAALAFARSRNPAIKCLTTRGTVLTSSTFTVEEDVTQDEVTRNDDRILATCLSLCRSGNKDQQINEESEPRRLKRDVVLLTEDRNLRVKALARDVPVREVPDFTQWAGLG